MSVVKSLVYHLNKYYKDELLDLLPEFLQDKLTSDEVRHTLLLNAPAELYMTSLTRHLFSTNVCNGKVFLKPFILITILLF